VDEFLFKGRTLLSETDYDIIQKVLSGDKGSFAHLVDRHGEKAMTLAMRILKNKQDAEEALQDAFIRAYNALPRFEWKASFSTWFYRIVYNVCVSALERRPGEVFVSVDEESSDGEKLREVESGAPLPDAAYESAEAQKIVHEEIERLPDVYGATFALFVVQEMSYQEIVEVTGLPLGTIKARLFRARTMLKDALVRRLGEGAGVRKSKEIAA